MPAIRIDRGGVYANAHDVFAREVIEITPDGYVIYNDYVLSDGEPLARQRRCSMNAFVRWAVRPLTSEEIRALRREEGEARERAMLNAMSRLAIEAASDELIRREFYRRGLHRLPAPGQATGPAGGGGEPPETGVECSPGRQTERSQKRGPGRRKSTS